MRTTMTVVHRGDEIALVSSNGGRGFLWFLVLELGVFSAYFAKLASEVGFSTDLLIPLVPSLALVFWTWTLMKPDIRIVMNVATGDGRLLRISPLLGAREVTRFTLEDVEGLTMRQITDWATGARRSEYIVDMQLRDGIRHQLSARGPLLAYNQSLAQFSRATGIGNRVVRLPVA